jgi:microsomal prostaglandin-E synthase 1
MNPLASNPSFVAYAITATILCLHLMILWALTGAVRAKTKTTPNAEDASTVAKGAKYLDEEPAAVSRSMRVYRNAAANILPFLILGFLYVVLGAPANVAWILFGVFTAARILHAIVYALGKQPWRTLIFAVAQLATLGVAVQVLRASFALL